MAPKRPNVFGDIPGIKEGHCFDGRKEMMPTSFHRVWTSGIDGNGKEGTSAIVLNGGYADDADFGDEILYTGEGENKNGKVSADQSWKSPGNAGLLTSWDRGLPVRVVRGYKHKSEWSPKKGYVYSGLYSVVDARETIGKDGFKICLYRLIYCGSNPKRSSSEEIELDYTKSTSERRKGTVLRIVRDTKISQDIKDLYGYKCQVCGTAIKTKTGLYAEGAHVKPIGRPHNGDDCLDNLICLCPNHHVMFDKGTFSVSDDFTLLGQEIGKLAVHPKHKINLENFRYHRSSHGYD
ncbi:YDG/SRA domain-containing protein [Vibrio sp. HN007]|uniref:YDG/SRA domain-containing protein n=1 Tax=Vibrio iocasae TaxID=3098914 RepID=UPI0035D4AA81